MTVNDVKSTFWIFISANNKKKHGKEQNNNDYYAHPLPLDPQKPWFSAVPIGRNVHSTTLKDCTEAGIEGHKTNHSLRTCKVLWKF